MKTRSPLPAMVMAFFLFMGGCQSPTRPKPAPRPEPIQRDQVDQIGIRVEKTDRTLLETLWKLEKSVRKKTRRISILEEELEESRREIRRLRETR